MAAKKKQTKAQARRKAMLKIKQEGLRKKGKIYGDAIKKIKRQETAAKVISGAGLLVPGSAPLVGAAKLGKVVRAAKAAKKAVKKKALTTACTATWKELQRTIIHLGTHCQEYETLYFNLSITR